MSTQTSFDDIIIRADEFAEHLKSHPISVRYQNILNLIKDDEKSRTVYERLVNLGKNIAETKDTGKELGEDFLHENEILRQELMNAPLVTEFVEAQKDYFEMMAAVQKKMEIVR